MSQTSEKRNVPSILRRVLAVDAFLTDVFANTLETILPLRQLRIHYKVLEVSCHGIPWLACWLSLIWIMNKRSWYQMQTNFLIGLIVDIIFVAILKAFTRRRRPRRNSDPLLLGPDKYSFPSGHASRATFIVYFFLSIWPLHFVFIPPLFAWLISICISRILMKRHYLLDLISGVLLGIFEGFLISLIYLDEETCIGLISWLTDEKVEGGDYHV
ncbi:inactive phospholipid phosphatase 7 [Orussus abietinus]|uniref:inactive phospholipid phosphatase 7 n=1 Tax=Orussus abietinus TaxID=222816 RepID=UPI00062611EF|nr:inactive phospholipid phosphatase 7 [Orussus abietinus]XP_012279411.1 inactive phospholipid phosphatase 7 [Orussus abietinus]